MPFAVARRDGLLRLTLDTPGSPVNIFNHATAEQLCDLLGSVTASNARAIVFETAKPTSFINGVGLLLAHASQNMDDVVRASTLPWAAYRAVREAPVPTIAAVQGSCFGCGVEFALNCDYRIAGDSCATRFYMTELNDYAFIPLFGSTWNLPDAVGIDDAINFLLWGERWGAHLAFDRGLVDEVAPHEEFADRTELFVRRVVEGTQSSRRRGTRAGAAPAEGELEAAVEAARRRVGALPPQYRKVYGDALMLLEAGASRSNGTYLEHQRLELEASAASALSPVGKAAYSFFYLRQMASERAAGRVRGEEEPLRICVDDADPGAAEDGPNDAAHLARDFRRLRLTGISFVAADEAEVSLGAPASVVSEATAAAPSEVGVRLSFADALVGDTELYAPTYGAGGRLVELATRSDAAPMDAQRAARLARTLQRFGLEVARTNSDGPFVTNRLLLAYLLPLVRYVEDGGEVATVNSTLREFGFVRRPHDVFGAIGGPASSGRGKLSSLLATELARPPAAARSALAALDNPAVSETAGDDVLLDGLALSLLGAVLAVRDGGQVRDTSIVDLVARELLDFPRHLCSLCTWLKTDRIRQALAADSKASSLVSADVVESAHSFVARGREFYR